ncbi:MAG: hypothetical protein AB8B97_07630 [Granulosicoccus sp.]
MTNPAQLNVGQLVSGQLVTASETDNFHTWQISLEPGNYHLIADAWPANEEFDTVGLRLTSLGISTSEDELLVSDSEAGYEVRLNHFLAIETPQTLTLRVEKSFDNIHSYVMGVLPNGSAVPSPTFTRCLPINQISLDSTQSVSLGAVNSRDDQVWYRLDLPGGESTISAVTSSAESATLGYGFILFDQFGEHSSSDRISADSEFSTSLTTRDTFLRDDPGPVWLRLANSFNNPITVEFTVN